jgi:CSLREA domain-containing protein
MGLRAAPRWARLGRGGFVALLLGLLFAWTILAQTVRGDVTINVNTAADETAPGDGTCSLREAVLYANGTTEADCAPGTAAGTTTINLPAGHYVLSGGALSITGNAAIDGAGASTASLDANGSSEVISVASAAQVTLSGVTVTGGSSGLPSCTTMPCPLPRSGNPGGGIYNAGALTLVSSSVTGNSASGGAAAVVSCTTGNACPGASAGAGGAGGGIYNAASGTLSVSNSTISGNTAGAGGSGQDASSGTLTAGTAGGSGGGGGAGGGIENAGTLTVTGSAISGNSTGAGGNGGTGSTATAPVTTGGDAGASGAGGAGGAIANTGTVTITNSTVSANATGFGGHGGGGGGGFGAAGGNGSAGSNGGSGGGIDSSTVVAASNSTITANTTGVGGAGSAGGSGTPPGSSAAAGSPGAGGALDQSGSGATLTQVTIASNTAAGPGGGLNGAGGSIAYGNSIIGSNNEGAAASNCAGTMITDQGNNVVFGDNSCGQAASPDPKLGALADNGGPTQTMALQAGSSAIDLVPTSACPLATDQRGVARPQGPKCDAGAYELAPPSLSGAAGTANATTTATVKANVNPNLKQATVFVQYGPSTAYGSTTANQDLGAGNSPAPFTAALSGLTPNTTYHARVVAGNGDGTTTGGDISFTTPRLVSASLVSASSSGAGLALTISCNYGSPTDRCTGPITVSSHVSTRAGKTVAVAASTHRKPKSKPKKITVVKLATGSYSVAAGTRVTVKLALSATGRKLLNEFYRLPTTVTVGGTTPITKPVTFSYSRIRSPVAFTWVFNPRYSIAQELTITGLPSKPKVKVICHGRGCPFTVRTFSPHGKRLALAPLLRHSHVAPHTTLELDITATNAIGKVVIFTIVSGRIPVETQRCLPPGVHRPRACV